MDRENENENENEYFNCLDGSLCWWVNLEVQKATMPSPPPLCIEKLLYFDDCDKIYILWILFV